VIGPVAMARRPEKRAASLFILFGGCLAFVQWALIVRQLGVHYTLHFTTWVVLGLTAAALEGWEAIGRLIPAGLRRGRALLLVPAALLPLLSLWIGLSGQGPGLSTSLLPQRFPPRQTENAEQTERLLEILRSYSGVSATGDPAPVRRAIYVAASSAKLSDDLLWHADRASTPGLLSTSGDRFWEAGSLNILRWTPFADSRDPFPLEKLVAAELVVIAEPVQYHMRPEEQRVVSMVVEAFTEQWPLSMDFRKLPEQVIFGDVVRVSLYQRVRQTTVQTAMETLRRMERYHGGRPGGQLPWMGLNPGAECFVSISGKTAYRMDSGYYRAPSELRYLYIDRPPASVFVHGFAVANSLECVGRKLRLEAVDGEGRIIGWTQAELPSGYLVEFGMNLAAEGAEGLLLKHSELGQAEGGKCWIGLQSVEVRPLINP
jgi:hypothetical protein